MADDEAEVLDNWEDQADNGMLDKRLEEMAIDVSNQRKKQVVSVAGKMVTEESGPTPYQPQVRILKRDTSSTSHWPQQNNSAVSSSSSSNSSASQSQGQSKHSKSFQQREAEYAQARLRILGSLPPPDDDEEAVSTENPGDLDGNKASGDATNISTPCPPQIVKTDSFLPRVAILRQPRSPDGTSGFKKPDHT